MITTINSPTKAVRAIAEIEGWNLIVVGDTKTPRDWRWPNTEFLSLDDQLASTPGFARACPVNHYARKNLGYLHAMANGATVIAETDDDNLPYPSFPGPGGRVIEGTRVGSGGWENVYRHFTAERIWPRGFPLELVRESLQALPDVGEPGSFDCAIHQYLADGDPDVDAVYRLTVGEELTFSGPPVVLDPGTYCPFNSQNTVWWADVFPLLYLPAYASFRMTDIWRSFIAQICLHAMGGRMAFLAPTVRQERNVHSLLHDFELEIPGYLHNDEIVRLLSDLALSHDPDDVVVNLRSSYEALVLGGFLGEAELPLLACWIDALPTRYRRH